MQRTKKVTKMELLYNGISIEEPKSGSMTTKVQGSGLKAGTYYAEASVYDAAGNKTTKKLTIKVK